MGTIYLVRHGQANPAAYGVPQENTSRNGGVIGGLTATGRVQAGLTGTLLAAQVDGFAAAISGDLPRQTETLAGVLERFDSSPPPIVDTGWNEYELPTLIGAATADEFADSRAYQQRIDANLA
ncbi:MAG: phosphoglycerate mutase family protein, partial [Gordonia sp. (in: high G+C Gram-positive bacteria)]